ncbi:hypothetical protein ACH4VS_09780 [Streptomyces hygroscopicus]|uniref:hypothetical protein n=1 Tax=Streptomyces hygroscopicus TaxID=1912 RepID=UPI001FCD3533|nr:hypothetical protein [Streptomyces hygroscopicus]
MASYIPKVHAEGSGALMAQHCSLDYPGGVADLAAHDEDQLSAAPPPLPGFAPSDGGSQFRGHRILLQCHAGLELLRQALHEHSTPYAGVLDTLCGRLPEPTRRERDAWGRLAVEGPPGEQVGLEPFGPPEQTGLDRQPAPGQPASLPYPTTRAFMSAKESR